MQRVNPIILFQPVVVPERQRERTNTQRARGAQQKGHRTKLAERTEHLPAGEDKGHPDGATRHTHREGREGGAARGGKGDEKQHRPKTPDRPRAPQT